MEVKVNEEEIIIKLAKKDHPSIFDRAVVMKDVKAYFEYLLNLDYQLNGSDDVLNGFPDLDSFQESIKRMSKVELEKVKESLLEDIFTYVKYIHDAVPEEYTYHTYDYDLEMIPEDNSIEYLQLVTDKLKMLLRR